MPMIVKGIRLRSSSNIGRTIRHLQNGDDNDAIAFICGTPADIQDMHRDAVAAGSKYSARHWIVAPHESTTRPQMAEIVENLGKEFAFDPARAVVVEHRKRRATTDAADVHWHVLVGEVDPATSRILATSYDWVRHELIARIAEFSFGHAFVPGKHSETVIKGLRRRNLHCVAERLEQFLESSAAPPPEAFTHARHQKVKRLGFDLPALKQVIKRAVNNARSREDIANDLAAAGLVVKAGDNPGTWIVVHVDDGALIGAMHRLAGLRKSAINILMERVALPELKEKKITDGAVSPHQNLPYQGRQPARAEPNLAVPTVGERIAERLAVMEQSALRELARAIPNFEPTAAMRLAKGASRHATDDLSRVIIRRSELQRQIANVPPIGWWSRFTGSAKRRQRELGELEASLEEVEAEVRRKEMAIAICHRKEVREEKAAQEIHAATAIEIAQQQQNARTVLAVLGHAKIVLEEKPDAVMRGLDFVLSMAKARLRRSDMVAEQLIDLSVGKKTPIP